MLWYNIHWYLLKAPLRVYKINVKIMEAYGNNGPFYVDRSGGK